MEEPSSQHPTISPTKTVLLLGFGDVNKRLAGLLTNSASKDAAKLNNRVIAVRRSTHDPEAISNPLIECRNADITDPEQLSPILAERPDQVVITIAPSSYSEQGYRQSYLAAANNVIDLSYKLGITPELVFVSSSSVYAHNNGELVNEESECLPTRYNGQVLLEAEHLLKNSALLTSVVRFAGIYGSGRHRLIGMCLKQDETTEPDQIHWTNRINADDCARVIEHVLSLPLEKREGLYLASDNLPVERHKVYNWIRSELKKPALKEPHPDTELPITGKRCDNSRLINSGFQFKYSTYKEGFIPVLAEYLNHQDD